jgi:hypothetical protein
MQILTHPPNTSIHEMLPPHHSLVPFSFDHYHRNLPSLGPVSQETSSKLSALNGLAYSVWCSHRAGLVLAFEGGMILPNSMLRNIICVVRPKLSWLFPAEENIWFHTQVAYSMKFWATVHTTVHYINFINVEHSRTHHSHCDNLVPKLNYVVLQGSAKKLPWISTTHKLTESLATSYFLLWF